MSTTTLYRIERAAIDELLASLYGQGYTVIGPTLRGAAIVLDEVHSASDLPVGWTNEQAPARYRLLELPVQSLFAYTVSPHSWKQFLFPPLLRLFAARKNGKGFHLESGTAEGAPSIPDSGDEAKRFAFLGVRSCDLHALLILDKVFGSGQYRDPYYQRFRAQVFIIAVNCALASGTCFCASMKTGPKASRGFDLALTEVITENDHYFTVEIGTDRGRSVLERLAHRPAQAAEAEQSEKLVENATQQMGRSLETDGIQGILYNSADHPRWEAVAARCLTCANCTMVCPTCFCTTIEDAIDLSGTRAERVRTWDSCFTLDFSYLHGGSVRSSVRARYRHWLTHKLASWVDQFGTIGCVGCGRCITWCPVGIDITEEYAAIRESSLPEKASSPAKEGTNGNA